MNPGRIPTPERSFLGPSKPSWTDLLRLRQLREMERVICERLQALQASSGSTQEPVEVEREECDLDLIRREMGELEHRLADL